MKTYLVPVDFSEAGFNAAEFAADLSHQTNVEDIILMNAYYISPYETLFPDPNMMMLREEEIEANAAERIANLETLKKRLSSRVREGVRLHVKLNRSHLLRAVVDRVLHDNIDLVIIGTKGNSSGEDEGIGSHVIKISKACPVPVLVVPPCYRYEKMESAVIACDFKKVTDSMPSELLHKLLGKQPIKLAVVHVDPTDRHKNADPELLAEESALHGMLKVYHPKYHYINSENVIKGILDFAALNHSQVVIALPHRYSFLQSILHSSISTQLASSASIPVLLLK
ncbi:nucleotide-binding universal stress UspA family protein [Mucilaginibacter yixingensis]|uniref:Nucleotide-binding universal stress UspA family protein n=1 Tax=Mucilaginibacter yixingensis TaxID=1295612 RepID=A0A2T5JFP8_9SPHI|nr:universal stress protein [Mucilaginibacter yixingensis]PTR01253.1 nucleotide-binding universal stress UspA family protein [Mucilaginibacter yixingensis]